MTLRYGSASRMRVRAFRARRAHVFLKSSFAPCATVTRANTRLPEPEWAWRSPVASSKRTADASGLKMRWDTRALSSSSNFPRAMMKEPRKSQQRSRPDSFPLEHMEQKARILVVDDEPQLTRVLR